MTSLPTRQDGIENRDKAYSFDPIKYNPRYMVINLSVFIVCDISRKQ